MTVLFTGTPVTDYESAVTADRAQYAHFFNYLLENGIYAAPSQFEAMFVSYAHTDEDITKTAEIIANYRKG